MANARLVPVTEAQLLARRLQAFHESIVDIRRGLLTPTLPQNDPDLPNDPVQGQLAMQANVPKYYANGAWHEFGGGVDVTKVAHFYGSFAIQGWPIDVVWSTDFVSDPVNRDFGSIDGFMSHPYMTIPPGGYAGWMGGCQFSGIDTSNGAYNTNVLMAVFNGDLSELMTIKGELDISAGGWPDGNSYVGASMSVLTSTGSDLSYDSVTGKVNSTAGGVYAMTASWHGQWA